MRAAGMLDGVAAAIRTGTNWIYGVAGVIWLAALAFAGYRIYQMRTLTPVEAEVLKAETDSYEHTSYSRDMDGELRASTGRVYVPAAWVRYQFGGRTFTSDSGSPAPGSRFTSTRRCRTSRCRDWA